jgi:hypothetical protein
MNGRLKNSPQIWRLASDLGIRPYPDPVSAILDFCRKRVRNIAREFKCAVLSDLLNTVAAALGTTFVEIHSESDLKAIQDEYLSKGEWAFATLDGDLGLDVLAITFRRTRRREWERPFVSIIDCRGEKTSRSYYSKWHELAHLLTLTDQMRLSFARTHAQTADIKDPEEALMEIIAGAFGFWNEILSLKKGARITFQLIDQLRRQHCPEASAQASIIGFVRAWPEPCVLMRAAPALKQREKIVVNQGLLEFAHRPLAELRAVKVTANDAAKEIGMFIYPNMRIPECSMIANVFDDGPAEGEAAEDLGRWTTSEGGRLADRPVQVQARRVWAGVEALITPV